MDFIALDELLKTNMSKEAKGRMVLFIFRMCVTDYEHAQIIELAINHRLLSEAQIMRFSLLNLAEAYEIGLKSNDNNKPPHLTVGEGLY